MPPAPVKRVPPPPFLALTLPTTSLIPKQAENERLFEPVGKDQGLASAKESKSLRYLIEKLNQINAEMEGDVARVKLAIGEAENGIKLLRAQRAYQAEREERPNIDIAPASLSENEARNDLQIC